MKITTVREPEERVGAVDAIWVSRDADPEDPYPWVWDSEPICDDGEYSGSGEQEDGCILADFLGLRPGECVKVER